MVQPLSRADRMSYLHASHLPAYLKAVEEQMEVLDLQLPPFPWRVGSPAMDRFPEYFRADPAGLAQSKVLTESTLAAATIIPADKAALPPLFPPPLFLEALRLETTETLTSQVFRFHPSLLRARDVLVYRYKALHPHLRNLLSKQRAALPRAAVEAFYNAWKEFEQKFLEEKETHAVEALMPLADCLLQLEPLLVSKKKEAILPWPRVQHQRISTLRCLEGFCKTVEVLVVYILGTSKGKQPTDQDPKLIVMTEAIVQHAKRVETEGAGPHGSPSADATSSSDAASYADIIKMPADRLKMLAENPKSLALAEEMVRVFNLLINHFLACRDQLEKMNPNLEQNEDLVRVLRRYHVTFAKCQRSFLEPFNLV